MRRCLDWRCWLCWLIDSPVLQYGDSPVCLAQDQRTDVHTGVTAITQGYGLTEFDTAGTLLETNVTIITTEECRRILRYNATSRITRNLLTRALPFGLDEMFVCAQGSQNEEVNITGHLTENI